MYFETSFDSKQPTLEPKLVSALSETKRLFRLFRFYTGTETESFNVSIEPKQTEDQPKQFDRKHILVFFWKFKVFSGFFVFSIVLKQFALVVSRVSDPHWFNADPDTDPDPAFFLIADPDPGSGV